MPKTSLVFIIQAVFLNCFYKQLYGIMNYTSEKNEYFVQKIFS